MLNRSHFSAIVAFALLAAPIFAKEKRKRRTEAQDQIAVVAHIPLAGGPVNRIFTTRHYSRIYVYAEHSEGGKATLVDVTEAKRPSILAEVAYPSSGTSDMLLTVAGTAAVTTSSGPASTGGMPTRTIRILNFADPQHPQVAHEFKGVTAIEHDTRRGLIYLVNAEGFWILQQVFALDPQVEEDYAHHVLYDR